MNGSHARASLNRIRLTLLYFAALLGLVIYTADVGAGPVYWGWLSQVPLGDKFCHFGFMLTLTALTNLSLHCRPVRLTPWAFLLGTAVVTVFVVGEEFSQIWIPCRNFDLLDLSADLIGIACGDLIARRWQAGPTRQSPGHLEGEELSARAV
jgi:hypothetical protein